MKYDLNLLLGLLNSSHNYTTKQLCKLLGLKTSRQALDQYINRHFIKRWYIKGDVINDKN